MAGWCAFLFAVSAGANAAELDNELAGLEQDGTLSHEQVQVLLEARDKDLGSGLRHFLNRQYAFPEDLSGVLAKADAVSVVLLDPNEEHGTADNRLVQGYRVMSERRLDDHALLEVLGGALQRDATPYSRYDVNMVNGEPVVCQVIGGSRCAFRPTLGLRFAAIGEIAEGVFCLKCREVRFYWKGELVFSGTMGPDLVEVANHLQKHLKSVQ